MKTMPTGLILLALLFMCTIPLSAADTGFVLDQNCSWLGNEDTGGTEGLEYSGVLIPWFSVPLGRDADLYLSAGLRGEYQNSERAFLPELLRAEIDWRFGGIELKAGRLFYTDPLGYTVSGLLDGAGISVFAKNSILSASVLYTGFLYKKSAGITMTEQEASACNEKLDYDNLWKTYFASRRIILALDWETIAAEIFRINLAALGQFDLNGGEQFHHSQYLEGRLRFPVQSFILNAALCLEPQETAEDFRLALAGELGLDWTSPAARADRLSFLARFSSGHVGEAIAPFSPINAISQGKVLKTKLSGISMFQLAYTVRLGQSLSASVESSYFVLSDLRTYRGWPAGRDGYFLGDEFFAHVVWSPASDLQLQAGGGVFLSTPGNAAPGGKPLWCAELKAILAVF